MMTAQVESFRKTLPEIIPLLDLHYDQLSLHKGRHELKPRYDIYLAREDAGELMLVTLRRYGCIVGYWITFIAPGLHYQTCLTGQMDIWFIHPAHRVGKAPLILIKAVEKELARRGVHLWFAGEKLHDPCGRLFEMVGMKKVESYYAKWIGE